MRGQKLDNPGPWYMWVFALVAVVLLILEFAEKMMEFAGIGLIVCGTVYVVVDWLVTRRQKG